MPLVLAGATSGQATITATDAATVTLTLPSTSGTLVSSGAIPAAGSNTQVQYNSGGSFAGNAGLTFDGTTFTTTGTANFATSSGNVGVGTASPVTKLNVVQSTAADALIRLSNTNAGVYASTLNIDAANATGSRYNSLYSSNGGTYQWSISGGGADSTMAFGTGSSNTERMRIDSSGNVFVGGTTQNTATNPVYSKTTPKVWCSWTGSSGAIQSSFNVSSVTRNATGQFTIAFSNALIDTNYAGVFGGCQSSGFGNAGTVEYASTVSNYKTTSQIIVLTGYANGQQDLPENAVAIFR
jgi:hypothetical protein